MSDWTDRTQQLEELAFIDEGAAYEVDQAGIYRDPTTKKLVLLTATGCSCWEGDYDEEQYDSLAELEDALVNRKRTYNPTLAGVTELVTEARKNGAA